MLAFQVEYLMGRAYGGSRDDRQRAEWPPHPDRLFSGLAAAYHQAGLGDEVRQALLWLERQPPPALSASDGTPRLASNGRQGAPSVVTSFVPHNYPRKQSGKEVLPWIRLVKGKTGRHFPSIGLDRSWVYFIWDAAAPAEYKAALSELAEYVGYMGTSASKVRLMLTDDPPHPDFEPSADGTDGELALRVPHGGRLAALERAYRSNRQAPPGPAVYYRRVEAESTGKTAQSEFDELVILRCGNASALPARHAVMYTSVLRDALLQTADGMGVSLSAIHGHDNAPHCAFLALPHTGHLHAESAIKAFAVAFPSGVGGPQRAGIRLAAARISQLHFGRLGQCAISPAGDAERMRTADPASWVGPSRTWTSVTPVLLDRFPKLRPGREITDIVAGSCARIGLPEPVTVEFGEYSPEAGVQPVQAFCLERKPGEQPRKALHVTVEFSVPVRGPVLLGAGRYFGLGLCKPVCNLGVEA